jgi:hypothetical protein
VITAIGNNKGKKSTMVSSGVAVVSRDELKEIRDKTEKGQKSDAIVISKSEIERMKAITKIQSKE